MERAQDSLSSLLCALGQQSQQMDGGVGAESFMPTAATRSFNSYCNANDDLRH